MGNVCNEESWLWCMLGNVVEKSKRDIIIILFISFLSLRFHRLSANQYTHTSELKTSMRERRKKKTRFLTTTAVEMFASLIRMVHENIF